MANSISHCDRLGPIKNTRWTMIVPYLDADGDPTDPTTPDTEISKDTGAFADTAEEVNVFTGSNGCGYITLTGAETNCSGIALAFKVASGPKPPLATVYPRVLAIVGSGTLSAGSAGGGTLGTVLAYDLTGCFIRTTGGTGGGGTGGANNQARKIVTYTVSSGAFTVEPAWETTPSTDTTYDVLLPEGVTLGMLRALNPTVGGRTLDVTATGAAGVDWGNVEAPTTTLNLSGTTVKTATDVETDTQDIQTKIGTPAGASVSADIAAIEGQTDDIGAAGAGLTAVPWNASWDAEVQSEVADALAVYDPPTRAEATTDVNSVLAILGTPAGASVSADIAAIEAQTDDIGVAGVGLTAVPWNAAWDAEVQSEVADALGVYDPPTRAEATTDVNSVLTVLGTPAGVSVSADIAAIEAQTDDIGVAGAGLTALASQASVNTIDGIVDDILLDTAEIGVAGAGLTNINLPNQTMDIVGNLTGNVTGSVGSVTTVSDKTGYRLSATGVDDVLDEVIEGSFTLRQLVRIFAAALAGKASGLATTTATYRDTGDSKDRIVATVDADGNRSAVTLDAS